KTEADIFRATVQIQEAIATIEQIACENYRRYCLNQWQNLNLATDGERARYYYQEFQKADQQLNELQAQRISIED
ncbi:MAG: DNA primase, partial [Cyanobacteria bacterium P01_H01_bin.15]